MHWYVHETGRPPQGPFTTEEVLAMRASGRFGADTLVCSVGAKDWHRLEGHPMFRPAADAHAATALAPVAPAAGPAWPAWPGTQPAAPVAPPAPSAAAWPTSHPIVPGSGPGPTSAPGPGAYPYPSYPRQPETSVMAILSLVLSLASWVFLPAAGAIAAVVLGHYARAEIRSSNGTKTGDGLALGGLIIGYIHIAFVTLLACIYVLFILGFVALLAGSAGQVHH